jgi:hypothetical protein
VRFKNGLCAVVGLLSLGSAGIAGASTFIENPDAGELMNTAADVPAGTTKIQGSIGPNTDVDLYRLHLPVAASVRFEVITTGEWFDDDMTLFNAAGNPIAVSDFAFTQSLPAGTFYFALSDWNIVALDGNGVAIADDYAGILNTSGVLGGWNANTSPFRFGTYDLNLTIQQTPEPATLLAAVGGLVALTRRRRENA